MPLVTHVSSLSQVTVPLAGGGDEDIPVVMVSHGRVKYEVVVAFLLVPFIVLLIKPDSVELRAGFLEED